MPMTVSELQVKVSADTREAESGLSALGSKLGSVGSTLATAFGGVAIAGVAGLTAGLAASVATAATFEAKMSAISAVTGSTADEMAALTTVALDLGAKTSFSASQAAEGINELAKAGVSVADIVGGGAAAALNLAAAGGLEVAEAAEIASNAMNVFGIEGSKAGHVADVIAGAANSSAIDVHDFGMSLSAVGAVANTVGIGFDDLGTAIAVMGQAGIKGSDAGTSLKTMLLNLSPSTDKAAGVMKNLGIITADGSNAFFDATGKAKSLAEISGVLATATSGLTEQQKLQALQTMFGTDAIRAAAIMAKAGTEGFNEMATSIGKVTAEAVAAERLNNLKGDVEQLTGSLETAGIKIGTAFLPGLRAIVQGSTEVVNQAAPLLETFARDAASGIQEASRQIGDAWRTAQQAFRGEWLPSDDIPPFVNAVGEAAIVAGKLTDAIAGVGAKANELGTMDALNRGMESLKSNSTGIATNVQGLSDALGRLAGSAGTAEDKINLLAAAVRTVAAGFENAVAVTSIAIDSIVQIGRTFVDFQTIMLNTGRAMFAWATGNEEAYATATRASAEAFLDMITSTEAWATRTASATAGVGTALQGVGQAAGVLQSDVQTATAGAATAAETGMAGVATASEANMAAAVAAVEAAAPQMAAAAETAASGAVAAVEAQQGAASAAGQGVGDSIGSGMLAGIRSWVGSIASAAASLVSQAIGAARAEADAHSPSKKTEQLGEDMAEGLEIGLSKSKLGEEMQAKIRAFIDASREYVPVAGQIARVEEEIKRTRDSAQTDYLFRAKEMITIDSEALRLKDDMVRKEKDLLPLRQDIARASREIAEIERGSLTDRTRGLDLAKATAEQNIKINQLEKEKIPLRSRELEIERLLLSEDPSGKRAKALKEEQDEIRKKNGLIDNTIAQIRLQTRTEELEMATVKERQTVASHAARVSKEEMDDRAIRQQRAIDDIKREIETLDAERAAFNSNEAIIKNVTENEIAYRNRLIAVFTAEGKPLADRLTAGLALVTQLEKEGKISKELANQLRDVAKEAGVSSEKTSSLGTAASTATPQMDAASKKAEEMAKQAEALARQAGKAADEMSDLAKESANYARQKGSLFDPRPRTDSGASSGVAAAMIDAAGSGGVTAAYQPAGLLPPIMSDGGRGGSLGSLQRIQIDVTADGQTKARGWIEGYQLLYRTGGLPSTFGGPA